MAKLMSKSQLVEKIAEQHPNNMTRKDVKGVIESLAEIGYKELKKTGAFFVRGLQNLLSSRSRPQRNGRASIRSQRSQRYSRRNQLGRSSGRAEAAKDAVAYGAKLAIPPKLCNLAPVTHAVAGRAHLKTLTFDRPTNYCLYNKASVKASIVGLREVSCAYEGASKYNYIKRT